MDAPTDEKLLADYLAGQTGSFELLVRRHAQELHTFVQRFTGDSAAAEDVVQESFLQVHHSADRFDPARHFKPWLFTIAANKARDYLRKRSRRREVPIDAPIGGEDDSARPFVDLLSADQVKPDEDLQMDERRRIVRSVVEEMPANLCEVLILAYFHRFPYKEISEIIGVPLGTVKSRLHAAVVWFGQRYRETAAQHVEDQQ